jgi:phosphoribosylformylglycinamidine synthase subunit PurS
MMKARVHISLKPGVLDPQGQAVENALRRLGFAEVNCVRQGKVIDLDLKSEDQSAAKAEVAEMCERLLANTVIETYAIEIVD